MKRHDKLFNVIKRLFPTLKPDIICIDFEKAAIKSLEKRFKFDIYAYLFHLSQIMKKKLGELHLIKNYKTNARRSFTNSL